jgi:hypothetical protein
MKTLHETERDPAAHSHSFNALTGRLAETVVSRQLHLQTVKGGSIEIQYVLEAVTNL